MTRINLDTAILADAGTRLGAAADAVTAAPVGGGPGDGSSSTSDLGDTELAAAYSGFWGAWAPTHRSLVQDVESISTALTRAAETFDDAEHVNVASLAALLGTAHTEPHRTADGSTL